MKKTWSAPRFLTGVLACMLMIISTGAQAWFNTTWNYRVPVSIPAGASVNSTIKVDVDFSALLTTLGVAGTLDVNSPRIVRTGDTTLSATQEFTDTVYAGATDAAANGRGEVRFILQDAGPATYYLYFDVVANGPKAANPQPPINGNFERGVAGTQIPTSWANATKTNANFDAQVRPSESPSITTDAGTPSPVTTDGTPLTGAYSYLLGARTNVEAAAGNPAVTLTRSIVVPATSPGNLVISYRPEGWDSSDNGATNYDYLRIQLVGGTTTELVGPTAGNYVTYPFSPNKGTVAISATVSGYGRYNYWDMSTNGIHRSGMTLAAGSQPWFTRTASLAGYAGQTITLRIASTHATQYKSWIHIDDVEWSVVAATLGTPEAQIDHFAIGIGSASASTCAVKSITITAQNAANATVTNYTGTVNITTTPAHGDWSKVTANGTLTPGAADSGAASYQFVALDNGVATLGLTDHHADGSLTITVVDNGLPSTSRTSSAVSFSDNTFVITNDAIQVAGRPQAMGVAMWRKDTTTGVCAISPYYTGAKNLKAWLTRDVDDPGGTAPTIGALSLPNALPGANNLALTFAAGSVSFNLGSTDVGKYVLNLRDDSRTFASVDINGSTSTITTRPFALVVSGIKQGATNNPANNLATGSIFAKAGSAFQATLGAYLWNSAADTNVAGGDGIPDAGATLAQITANGATPSYRWLTTLSAGIPFTPATPLDAPAGAGTAGVLSNGGQSGACPAGTPNCFTSGVATPTNLSYAEVGSFTLSGTATSFLNTSGVNLSALVFDNSATPLRNGVVGRFIPDHFDTVVTGGMLCPVGLTCPALFNGFVYSGQPFAANVIARNLNGATTLNYDGSLGFAKVVTLSAWDGLGSTTTQNPPAATPGALTANAVAAAAFKNGETTTGTPAAPVYTLPNAFPGATPPPGPTDIYLRAVDTDAVISLRGVSSVEGGIKIVSGRVMVPSAYGSELLGLSVNNVLVQYYNGTRWVTSSTDTTVLAPGNVILANCQKNLGSPAPACKAAPIVEVASVSLVNGVGSIVLKKPGAGNDGSVDVSLGAAGWPAWLPSTTGRAAFGVYKSRFIYLREMY